jgi:hypothetical protein
MQCVKSIINIILKSSTSWDIMQCNPLKVNGRFGGTFRRATRRYIAEDGTHHNHCCENIKSYKYALS